MRIRLTAVMLAAATLMIGCVPDAFPDPCNRCEGACSTGECRAVPIAQLDGAITAFDVGPSFAHACVHFNDGTYALLDLPKEGGDPAVRKTGDCDQLRANPNDGYLYASTGAGIMRGPLDGGTLTELAPITSLRSMDVGASSLLVTKFQTGEVFVLPSQGGAERQVSALDAPVADRVRLSAGGRYAIVTPEDESIAVGTLDDHAAPRTVFNAQRPLEQEVAPIALTYAGERLVAAHHSRVFLVEESEPLPPEVLVDGLVGPIELAADAHLVVYADAASGRVGSYDLETGIEHVLGRGFAGGWVALDDTHVYLAAPSGAVTRLLRPDAVR